MNRTATIPLLLIPFAAHAAPQCSSAMALAASTPPPVAATKAAVQNGLTPSARPFTVTEIAASPALTRLASHGASLSDLGSSHGLQTVFAKNGERFQVFYIAPDRSAVIGGVMWDAAGHNVTRDQVAPIQGTIPTVTYNAKVSASSADRADATALDHVTYGLAGRSGAPRVWLFIDPLCPFSVRAMGRLQPYLEAGRLQLALIPISINDHENNGASTAAALALLDQPRDRMVTAWTTNTTGGLPSAGAATALANNMAAAEAVHLQGTPTTIWTSADGTRHQAAGLPDDLDAWLAGLRA